MKLSDYKIKNPEGEVKKPEVKMAAHKMKNFGYNQKTLRGVDYEESVLVRI